MTRVVVTAPHKKKLNVVYLATLPSGLSACARIVYNGVKW